MRHFACLRLGCGLGYGACVPRVNVFGLALISAYSTGCHVILYAILGDAGRLTVGMLLTLHAVATGALPEVPIVIRLPSFGIGVRSVPAVEPAGIAGGIVFVGIYMRLNGCGISADGAYSPVPVFIGTHISHAGMLIALNLLIALAARLPVGSSVALPLL